MEIRNASLALRITSLFEVIFSRGTSSMLSIELARRVKWSETGLVDQCVVVRWLLSVLIKSVAEMTFTLAYILNVAFVALYHVNEIGRRAGDVMSYASLFVMFVGREKSVMKEQVLHLFPWQRKAPKAEGLGCGVWPWPVGFCKRRYDIREENASRHRCEERRMLRLLAITWGIFVSYKKRKTV